MARIESCGPVDTSSVAAVRFEYRPAGSSGPWTLMNAMNGQHPNPDTTLQANKFAKTSLGHPGDQQPADPDRPL
jgi:hypothetical protein